MEPAARRLYRLVEPIHLVTYLSGEPTEALMALGHRNYWDGYFAGRAAPLGRVPAEVVHAISARARSSSASPTRPRSGRRSASCWPRATWRTRPTRKPRR